MRNKLTPGKTFFICLVAGVTTGMGNGSVFGAAVMSAVGRGKFDNWGGWGLEQYSPTTFAGFIDVMMIVFGVAFATIVSLALRRHGELEAKSSASAAARFTK